MAATGLAAAALLVGQLPPTAHAASTSLSGAWSGKYSGAYKGTFTLHWTQSGSHLNGTIRLSASRGIFGLKGTVHGGAIRFGTVGGPAITYSGSASGSSMSGRYQTPNGGGPWSAHKTSS
ncbi:MAG TPA: hypothetical protein VGQ38_18765 [Gaiellaceae bacterium]|nr:hypothetical protein [Gaiellaceae bacterium]